MNQLCKVCGEPAAGFHFGAFTCEGCKSFFGRTYNNVSGIAECKNGGRCEINKKNRTSCKSCRLRKCLQVGMSKSGSRYGRRSNWFKIHCLLQAQGQQNGMSQGSGSGETNNNNSTVSNNNSPKSQLPSTITSSFSPQSQQDDHHHHHRDHRDRDIKVERQDRRTPSSSSSRNQNGGVGSGGVNGFQSTFPNLSRLSPESLSSLNRKLNSSDLADYFRAAGIGSSLLQGGGGQGGGGSGSKLPGSGKSFNYSEDERGEDMSRTTTRSPGSLESPRSETSVEEGKGGSMFTMPPGSPSLMDVKPNDLLSFDLITRDLMKMGYDPLRLWPAMIGAQPNLHSFNPYRFMFPNFPGAAAAAFPGGFPGQSPGGGPGGVPGVTVPSPLLVNGAIHPAKLFSAASLAGAESPLSFSAANLSTSSQHGHHSPTNNSSSSNRASPPMNHNHPIRSRVTPIVPPSPSLTLTPPISHHGSDDPSTSVFPIPLNKLRGGLPVPLQEKPIDLSAKSTNNNHIDENVFIRGKRKYSRINNGDMSDMEDDESDREDSSVNLSNREFNSSDVEMKYDTKSEYGDEEDSDHHVIKGEEDDDDEDEVELDLSRTNNNNNVMSSLKANNNKTSSNKRISPPSSRRSSCSSRSPSTERVGTPLDLTGGRSSSGTSNNPSPPAIPKIAT